MSTDLSTALPRWETLLSSARQRAVALPREADARLTALITDGGHSSSAFDGALSSLDSRVQALLDEIDGGWRGLSLAFDGAMDRASLAGQREEARRLRWQRAAERKKADEIRRDIERDARRVDVEARADAARALFAAALAEWELPRLCSACGHTIETGALHAPVDFRCGRCGRITRMEPGPAARAYLDERRIGALAEEATLSEWVALDEARLRFTAFLHPVEEDFKALEEAARRCWTAWATALRPLHPGWDDEEARRVAELRTRETIAPWSGEAARGRRALLTEGSRLVREGRQRELLEKLRQEPGGAVRVLEDLSVSLHEHEDRTAAWQCLALVHHAGRISEERDAWMRRRIAELDEDLRTR